jgi:hypothetical protein
MQTDNEAVKLRPVVRFREFPFGTMSDPSMREFMAALPRENEAEVVAYLKSGLILAYPMGADLLDWFDRPARANPTVEGKALGGTTPMTDGQWFWYAGLIAFIEKYHVRLPDEFVEHARQQGWCVNKEAVPRRRYDYSYFPTAAIASANIAEQTEP